MLRVFPTRNGANMIWGDTSTVSEQHISYLLRQWETSGVDFSQQPPLVERVGHAQLKQRPAKRG